MVAKTLVAGESTLAYDVSVGAGIPLVFVHGWGCSRRDWDGVIAALGEGRTTVAIDLPGFGESHTASPVATMAGYADDVAAVLQAEGLTGVVAIGHSMGGAVVLELAARHPELVARVVGVDTYHYLQVYPKQSEAEIAAFIGPFSADLPAGVRALVEMSSVPSTPESVKARVRAAALAAEQPIALTALEDSLRWDLDAALALVSVPVSAIVAEPLFSSVAAERYADRIAFVPFTGGSHYFLFEYPEQTAELLLAQIDG